MKRYYYITIVAVASICLLQAFYVISLYNHYVDEETDTIDNIVRISIDKERYIRSVYAEGKEPKTQQYLSVRTMDDMTPEERDSITRVLPIPEEKSVYNVDEARKKGVVNPEKRLGRFYKNQAFQKVQKRNVHEKR